MTTTLAIPDLHTPYHDRKAWALVLKTARELQPKRIVILGDMLDAYSVSSFPKDPARVARLADEISEGNVVLDEIGEAAPKAEKIYCCGNHSYRLEKFLAQKAPELFGLVDVPTLLSIKKRGWLWVPYRQHVTFGKISYTHECGYAGKGAVSQSLESFGANLVIGHVHTAGIVYGGTIRGEHRVAMSCGWLGDVSKIDYAHRSQSRNWQHGCGVVHQDSKGNGWVSFCPIINGRICIDGTWIGSNTK